MEVSLLEDTFYRIGKENGGLEAFGMRFYERLFATYPAVRPLFHSPTMLQHKKLTASLAVIVNNVTRSERLLPYLHAMGIRHLAYGTQSAHYEAVGENLLAVLGEHLSAEGEWTDEMRETWAKAIETVAAVMIEAAEAPEHYVAEMKDHGYLPQGTKLPGDQTAVYTLAG